MSDARSTDLQAVILAAGYGRRMSPLSDNCHKALLSIGGTTILGRIMDGLCAVGVNEVTVVTGYRAADIETFLRGRYPAVTLSLVNNPRYRETNNIASLALALDQMSFERDVLLIECDLLFDPSLLVQLAESPGRNVALVDHYRTGMDGTVVAVEKGFVSGVYPTDVQDANFSYEGKFKTLNMYRFDREFCRKTLQPLLHAYATQVDSSCYYELVLGMLSNIPAHRISAEVVSGERWVEVDDPNDLAVASFRFEPDRRSEILSSAFGGHWNFEVLDFSFMRNAYFPTGAMLAAMRHALPELVGSYGSAQHVLNRKLGYVLHCDPSRLQVLHGAAQAFPILARILGSRIEPHQVALPEPTFGEYPRVFPGARTYPDHFEVDWRLVEHLASQSRVFVVVNPNTTTGTTVPTAHVYDLAKRLSSTIFLVDESFLAFSGQPSLVQLLEKEPLDNVVVLTSLSKCLGTPGLRLGYLYTTNADLVASVGAEIPVWNLGAPTEFLLELLVKFNTAYVDSIVRTGEDREQLRGEISSLSCVSRVRPSGGNFLVVELEGPAATAGAVRRDLLTGHGIEVKDVTDRFEDGIPRLRLGVRLPPENAVLVEALSEVFRSFTEHAELTMAR